MRTVPRAVPHFDCSLLDRQTRRRVDQRDVEAELGAIAVGRVLIARGVHAEILANGGGRPRVRSCA